jgi:2-polyprenyl-3-methyl-5-hydroxy-6-metoxy-1,4-benzoquinol methylase
VEESRVRRYYEESTAEHERLARREGKLELVRTRELLERFLPASPARVIDVGGGTGAHASWLAAAGYSVHLVDLVPAHVETAAGRGGLTAAVGDARSLAEPDGRFDVALLLGPLYHLADPADRERAIREACRVVRGGGLVVAAFISRSAAVLDGFVKGWIDRPGAVEVVAEHIRGGSAALSPGGFSSVSYFHRPSEALAELRSSGLEVLGRFGVEGPGWVAADFDARWETAEGRRVVLESARLCEEYPELRVLSAHLLAFCRNPEKPPTPAAAGAAPP